jgi:glycopeptide antibiotics resistance protein
VLLTLIDPRVTLPVALATTAAIESIQALLLDARTASVLDVVANLTGAGVGLLLTTVVQRGRVRRAVVEPPSDQG